MSFVKLPLYEFQLEFFIGFFERIFNLTPLSAQISASKFQNLSQIQLKFRGVTSGCRARQCQLSFQFFLWCLKAKFQIPPLRRVMFAIEFILKKTKYTCKLFSKVAFYKLAASPWSFRYAGILSKDPPIMVPHSLPFISLPPFQQAF